MMDKNIKEHNELMINIPFYQKISYEDKIKENGKWIEDCIKNIDINLGQTDLDYLTKLDVNLAIIKGKCGLTTYNKLMKDRRLITNEPNKDVIPNYDIISPIYKSMVGEEKKRSLVAVAKDISGYNQNLVKQKKQELYKNWYQDNIHKPLQSQATQEILLKHKIDNPSSLSPEEQQQINSEIQEAVKLKSITDIDRFMTQDYKSPSETQIQEILDWGIKHFNMKFQMDEAFKLFIPAGRSICYNNIENFKPVSKLINPKGFNYLASENTYFIKEGYQWKNEEFISYPELISSIPSDPDFLKELNNNVMYSTGLGMTNPIRRQVTGELPDKLITHIADMNSITNGSFSREIPRDLLSPSGQQFLSNLYAKLGNTNLYYDRIRRTHIVYTSFARVFYVVRYNSQKDSMEQFWVGENYETNPELDVRVEEYWVPEYWEAKMLGYNTNLIYDKKRVEFQNRSVDNPFDIIPPYDGIEYMKLFSDADKVTPLDGVKIYQNEYNEVKKHIKQLEKENIGRVFGMPQSFIPDNYTTEEFVAFMKEHKFFPIAENENSLNPNLAAQIFKSIDLTKDPEINNQINRLNFIKHEAEQVLCYNPSTMGQAAASMTATVNQQNVIQSSYKTEDLYDLHKIFQSLWLNNFVAMMRNALTKDEDLKNALLSIPSLSALNVDTKMLLESLPFIQVVNDEDDLRSLAATKEYIQPMIQNGIIRRLSEVMMLSFKTNPAEIMNFAKYADDEAERAAAQARKDENDKFEKDLASRERVDMEKLRLEAEKFKEELKYKYYDSNNRTLVFQKGNDSNDDNVPDSVQVALINAKVKEKEIAANAQKNRENNNKDIIKERMKNNNKTS